MEIIVLGINEKRVFIEAILVDGNDFIVGDVLKAILYQTVIKTRLIALESPGPHLHGLFRRTFVGVAINDAIPQHGRAVLVEEDTTTVYAYGVIVHHGKITD